MELMSPEETNQQMKSILCYGALLKQNKILEKKLKKEKVLNMWLYKETEVQRRLISQIKSTKPNVLPNTSACTYGHHQRMINHTIYNYVRPQHN